MLALFNRFLDLALMRLPPQAFPASRFLLGIVMLAFMVLALLSNWAISGDIVYALARAVLSVVSVALAAGVILLVAGRRVRWQQTVTALYGGEVVLMVFMLPVLVAYLMEIMNLFVAISQWLLIIWEIVFIGHVYRNALDTGMGVGVVLALIYVIGSMIVKQAIVPFPAGA